ncbi:MAG: hypothetical protein AAF604_11735 [Acidobacteriota bacterium]
MPSKMVTDRQKSSLAVEAAASTHAAEVAATLTSRLAEWTEGEETVPDLELLQRLLGRLLAARRAAMVAADESHLDELADDSEPRRLRDERADKLRVNLRALRDLAEGLFGEGQGQALGLEGPVSADPVVLERQARRAMERLADESVPLPPTRMPSLQVDRADWLQVLEPDLTALADALAQVARERREAESSLLTKQGRIAEYDEAFLGAARLLEALYRTAGQPELADRVRPSSRRPGTTVADPEPTGAESEDDATTSSEGNNP